MSESRELAAIMFTDIVGYTSLMGEDEELAFKFLDKNREIHRNLMAEFNGKFHKDLGDGILCSFPTILSAVKCALAIQNEYADIPELELKIGIHQAEVVYKANDVFGDGVNIASRIESIAQPGSVYVSESVYRNIHNKKGLWSEYIGEKSFKNVKHPIKIYEIRKDPIPRLNIGNINAADSMVINQEVNIIKKSSGGKSKINMKWFAWTSMVVVLVILGVFVFPKIFGNVQESCSVCVLIPDPDLYEEGAFYQDGRVQKQGFEDAVNESDKIANRIPVHYQYMRVSHTADSLMDVIKREYDEGATYFIMTMSSKIEGIRDHFISWHNSCKKKRKRLPVLIATVASAPGLADIDSGIVRWYIRSEEESTILAKYLRWSEKVNDAAIFYISRSDGQNDDTYGNMGSSSFKNEFSSLGGNIVYAKPTTANSAEANTLEFLHGIRSGDAEERNSGVFIVGYGSMVTTIPETLAESNYLGPVACSSTLTEPEWQPEGFSIDRQTFTVLPKIREQQMALAASEKNVVYFFCRETLKRALEITSLDSDPTDFLKTWQYKPPAFERLEQTMLPDGDCIVELEVVDEQIWRVQ